MKIKENQLPKEILKYLLNPDPLEGEDIVIENDKGEIVGAIIQPDAYKFLIRKISEIEDENDSGDFEDYNRNAPSLDDLMGE